MRERNIKSVLRKKLDDWTAHIDDAAVQALVKRDALVTGGSIASMLLGEEIQDFDVYFKTQECTAAVAKYYVEKFKANPPPRFKNSDKTINISVVVADNRVKVVVKSQGIAGEETTDDYQYFESVADDSQATSFVENVVGSAEDAVDEHKGKPKYRPVFITSNAITLSHKVQIVLRFWGPLETIHENYDFVHCTCGWDYATGELSLPIEALKSLLARHLTYKSSKYPLCSLIRTRKFIERGWTIDAGQYVKMAWELNGLDLTDVAVLEDQMVGVDAAYFHQVVELLRKHSGEKVDGAYLIQVIDRIFG